MRPYIELNGVNSLSFGLGLINADLSLLPVRRKERETLYGAIRSLEGEEYLYPGGSIPITLAAQDINKAAVMGAFNNAASWLSGARFIRLWSNPDYYYEGAFEGSNQLKMVSHGIGEITFDFVANPGCAQRVVGLPAGWIPALDTPIPEQITEAVYTVKNDAITGAAVLPSAGVDLNAVYPPALHLKVTGTWITITIGETLHITEAAESSSTIYIDCDRMQVYKIVDGVRQNVKHNGDFPLLPSNGGLNIDGTGMNISVKMIVIERR